MTSAPPVEMTSPHVTGNDNPGFSDEDNLVGAVCSILKPPGSGSRQNSVKFQSPTTHTPAHAQVSDPSDLAVTIAEEEAGDKPNNHMEGDPTAPHHDPTPSHSAVENGGAPVENGTRDAHTEKDVGLDTGTTIADPTAETDVVLRRGDRRGHCVVDLPIEEKPRYFIPERDLEDTLLRIRQHFVQFLDKDFRISEEGFKAALGTKAKSFFVDRFFWFLDKDRNGYIDMAELTEGARILLSGTTSEKVGFVFTLYDTDNSGDIQKAEMHDVLTSCVKECKMKLKNWEIEILTDAMYDHGDLDRDGALTRADMTRLLEKHPHALDSLTYNAAIWLQPITTRSSDRGCSHYFTKRYLTNNARKITFLALFWLITAGLFVLNAYLYRDENGWVIFARGCGMCINFTSCLVILLPLRNAITYLRTTFLFRIFPLDHNISLHKYVGMSVFLWSCLHTVGHLGNAVILSDNSNMTLPEIFFTRKADMGWIAGLAPVTGVALLAVMVVIVLASRSCIRRTGHFEMFYWSHKLYHIYYIVCFIHATNFWKYAILPGLIFYVDKFITYIHRRKATLVKSVCLLPSEVTQLNIKKPPGFTYRPGDYVHLKIPEIAFHEWHPFTISSAPERGENFSVHIRSAGNWTRNLREYLLNHVTQQEGAGTERRGWSRRRGRGSSLWGGSTRPRSSMARKKMESIKGRTVTKDVELKVYVDGPYGSPCRNIFEAEHAILIGSGIGATPFASILQSIAYRFQAGRVTCPTCNTSWCPAPRGLVSLRKVDFVWINRDQTNFEWFTSLLSRLEQQISREEAMKDAITMHMFMTGAPSKYDITGVGVHMALDLVKDARDTDLITGLTTRTQGGRPDFDLLFSDIKKNSPCSKLKVFFCGNPALAKTIHEKCMKHDIDFSKEQF